MLWILPDWLCFCVGLIAILSFLINFISRFIKMPHNLHKRYGGGWAVVTGGSDGIGLGFSQQLAKMGFNICIMSRSQQKIDQACTKLKLINNKIQIKGISADFSKSFQADFYPNLMKQIQELDISLLVNNVGVLAQIKPYVQITPQQIFKQLTVNTMPAAMMTRYILPKMLLRQKRSGVVTLSSFATYFRQQNSVGYCSTKLFDDIFSRGLQYQYNSKVDFLSVRPGFVTTQMTRNTNTLAHVSKNQCALGSLRSLGQYSHYAGSWWHEVHGLFVSIPEEIVRDYFANKSWNDIKEKYRIIDQKKKIK